ncbi:MAG TPA: signal recognition particle-docking protein FtsY [Acidimicrobiales bacterium]|jgi:fused signal recognition particle receptor
MLTLIIVLIAVAVVVLVSAGFVVTGRRRVSRPPDRPVAGPASPPADSPATTEAPEATETPETEPIEAATSPPTQPAEAPVEVPEPPLAPPRMRERLGRARSLFAGYLISVRSRDRVDDATWEELEEALILADVGAGVTSRILDDLRRRVKQDGIVTPEELVGALKSELVAILDGDRKLHLTEGATNVWLFVGVNGVGKTTTIGKLGMRQARQDHRVVMAAGDTFRAAAADQLNLWAERVGASFIRGHEGGDPGAVVFDAIQHAAARHADLVLADTAGRLHTKTNLMEELKKVRRVAERPPGHVTEVLLVIDATTGQNGLIQAQQFAAATGVTGVVLTKLDGTAKGGIALAIQAELGIPIKLVGLGEGPEDLVEFDAEEFVDALLSEG